MRKEITHAGDDLLNLQMPRATRKSKGDVYRIDVDHLVSRSTRLWLPPSGLSFWNRLRRCQCKSS